MTAALKSMAVHHRQAYEVIKQALPGGSRFRHFFRMTCCRCGGQETQGLAPNSAPVHIQKRFHTLGWTFGTSPHHAVCPRAECRRRSTVAVGPIAALETYLGADALEPEPAGLPADETQEAPIMPADKNIRVPTFAEGVRISRHLMEVFDPAGGTYLDGWSDAKTADHLGLPRIMVETCRDGLGLVLRVDPAVVALEGECQALKAMVQDLERKIAALRDRK